MAKLKPMNQELYDLIRKIPKGKVASYGDLGRALSRPVSGFLVGRAMRHCGDDGVPWWRVVAKNGTLPVSKLDPAAASEQQKRLVKEGVEMADEWTVARSAFVDVDLL